MMNCLDLELRSIFGDFDFFFSEGKNTYLVRDSGVFKIPHEGAGLVFSGLYDKNTKTWHPSGPGGWKPINKN